MCQFSIVRPYYHPQMKWNNKYLVKMLVILYQLIWAIIIQWRNRIMFGRSFHKLSNLCPIGYRIISLKWFYQFICTLKVMFTGILGHIIYLVTVRFELMNSCRLLFSHNFFNRSRILVSFLILELNHGISNSLSQIILMRHFSRLYQSTFVYSLMTWHQYQYIFWDTVPFEILRFL